ncbi:MAG: GNAT family N-acetyltransferase [Massilia sp.]
MKAGGAPDIEIYENEIPEFVAAGLDRLYETVYCTLARFNIYGEADNASTYVARSGGNITCLILFRVEGATVRVVNQQIALAQEDLRGFAAAIFARYRQVRVISFYAIDAQIDDVGFPFQKFAALEENMLALPATAAEYISSISPNLWKRIQAAERKLRRDHPDCRFEVLAGREVGEPTLREVVALAGARMASKQKDAYLAGDHVDQILRLIHAYGFVGILRVDGVIRAGNVFYGVGQRYFMHVIAHDPGYDLYMPGHMVHYMAACYCIERGGRECCLMGGGRENKARFGAFSKYLDSVDIYRSRLQYMLAVRRVSAGTGRQLVQRAKANLLRLAKADGRAARLAALCLELARSARQSWRVGASSQK